MKVKTRPKSRPPKSARLFLFVFAFWKKNCFSFGGFFSACKRWWWVEILGVKNVVGGGKNWGYFLRCGCIFSIMANYRHFLGVGAKNFEIFSKNGCFLSGDRAFLPWAAWLFM